MGDLKMKRDKVDKVMNYIHGIAYRELQGDDYILFLQDVKYAINDELFKVYNDEAEEFDCSF